MTRETNSFDNPTYGMPPLTTDLNTYQEIEASSPSATVQMEELELNGKNIERFNTGLAPLSNSDDEPF